MPAGATVDGAIRRRISIASHRLPLLLRMLHLRRGRALTGGLACSRARRGVDCAGCSGGMRGTAAADGVYFGGATFRCLLTRAPSFSRYSYAFSSMRRSRFVPTFSPSDRSDLPLVDPSPEPGRDAFVVWPVPFPLMCPFPPPLPLPVPLRVVTGGCGRMLFAAGSARDVGGSLCVYHP